MWRAAPAASHGPELGRDSATWWESLLRWAPLVDLPAVCSERLGSGVRSRREASCRDTARGRRRQPSACSPPALRSTTRRHEMALFQLNRPSCARPAGGPGPCPGHGQPPGTGCFLARSVGPPGAPSGSLWVRLAEVPLHAASKGVKSTFGLVFYIFKQSYLPFKMYKI